MPFVNKLNSGGYPRHGTQISMREIVPINLGKNIIFANDPGNTNAKGYPTTSPSTTLGANPSVPAGYAGDYVLRWTGSGRHSFLSVPMIVRTGFGYFDIGSGGPTGSGDFFGNCTIQATAPYIKFCFGAIIQNITDSTVSNGAGGTYIDVTLKTGYANGIGLADGIFIQAMTGHGQAAAVGQWNGTKISAQVIRLTTNRVTGLPSAYNAGDPYSGPGGEMVCRGQNLTWRLDSAGTWSSYDNFALYKFPNEARYLAGELVDPDYIDTIRYSGAKWLRWMDLIGQNLCWDNAFTDRVSKDSMFFPGSGGSYRQQYWVGTITNTGSDVYTCSAPPVTQTGAYKDGEIVQGVWSATNAAGFPTLNVNGRGAKKILTNTNGQYTILISGPAASAGLTMRFTLTASPWLNGGSPLVLDYTTTASGPFGSDLASAANLRANLDTFFNAQGSLSGRIKTRNSGNIRVHHITGQAGALSLSYTSGPAICTIVQVVPGALTLNASRATLMYNYLLDAWMQLDGAMITPYPIEYLVEVCNRTNSNLWYNWPVYTTSTFVQKTTEYVRDNLNPGLKFGTEVGNEMWNFGQSPWNYALAWGYALGIQTSENVASYSYTGMRSMQWGAISIAAWTTTRPRNDHYILGMSAQWDIANTDTYMWQGTRLDATATVGGITPYGTYGGANGTDGSTCPASSYNVVGSRPGDVMFDGLGIAPYWGSDFLAGTVGGDGVTNTFGGTVAQNAPLFVTAKKYADGNTVGAYDDLYGQFYSAVSLGGPAGGLNLLRNYKNDNYPQLEKILLRCDSFRGKRLAMMHYEAGPQIGLADINNGTNTPTQDVTLTTARIQDKITNSGWDITAYFATAAAAATALVAMVYYFKFSPQYAQLYTNYHRDVTYVHSGRECVSSNYGCNGPSQWSYFPADMGLGLSEAYSSLQATADFNAGR